MMATGCSSSTTALPTAPASWPTGSRPSSPSSTCCTARRRRGSVPPTSPGFRRALAEGAELVLEMDCDFSHDPADVPRLIAAAEDGADLVLGSRYVPGGVDPELGARPAGDLARWERLRAGGAAEPRARPHRRVQVLPASGPRDDRPRRDRLARATPSRSRRPTASLRAGLPGGRGADRVRRPRARHVEDEPVDRARGGVEGAARCGCEA